MHKDVLQLLKFKPVKTYKEIISEVEDHGEIHRGILIVRYKNNGLQLFPIIDGFLIALTPSKIVNDSLKREIKLLFKEIKTKLSFGDEKACQNYILALEKIENSPTLEEFRHYEKYYEATLSNINNRSKYYGDHWFNAVKEVLEPMKNHFQKSNNKWVLELAGGDFYTLASVYPQARYSYKFIGTEISFNALKCGKRHFPNGNFILCDSDNLIFDKDTFDIIFVKGAIHHQQKHEDAIPELFDILKDGGVLGITEVASKKLKTSYTRKVIKNIIEPQDHTSPLNEYIDYHKTINFCKNRGKILYVSERGSILRYFLVKMLKELKTKSFIATKFIYYSDKLINQLIPKFRYNSTFILNIVAKKFTCVD